MCLHFRRTSISYLDGNNKLIICSKCYKNRTGKHSRVEKAMSQYLDNISQLKPFLIGSDKSFKSLGGCSLKRPDKLYISHDISLWIECDEHQHMYANGNYLCDEKRISDCFDELPQNQLIVIRWNPHKYKKCKKNKTRQERLEDLKSLIFKVLQNRPKELIKIYYMYYDEDNEFICFLILYKFIYTISIL